MNEYIPLPRRAIDLTGQHFGRLTVLGPIRKTRQNRIVWHCVCACGNEWAVRGHTLREGSTQSCGCLGAERRLLALTTHGMSGSPIYHAWVSMNGRCTNPVHPNFHLYGGRGITVCATWQDSFEAFVEHVSQLSHFGEKGYSLDRIDNDGNYEPGNIRWSTHPEQMRNTRLTHMLSFNGKTQCLTDWSEELQIREQTLHKRLKLGWSIERTLTAPVNMAYSRRLARKCRRCLGFKTIMLTDGTLRECPACHGSGEQA